MQTGFWFVFLQLFRRMQNNAKTFLMSFHSWNMAEGLYRCVHVCLSGWRCCVLPVDEHVLLHVAGRVSQTLTGQGLVVVPVIPQHNTQTEKQWGEPAVNGHHQNRTERNRIEQSHDDVTRFLYVISLRLIFKPSPICGSITDGNALLFRSKAAVVVF